MADRYWVGGTASWDATAGTKWALTSGGAGGQAVPTATDDVFFNAASGTVTVTVAAAANCLSLNFTGFTGTIAGTSNINVFGNFTLSSGMTWSHAGGLLFDSTTTGRQITTAGRTISSAIFFGQNQAGGGWTLQDAFTTSSSITVTRGTFTTNNFNVTATQLLSNNTNTRTINLGSSVVTLSSNTPVNFTTSTGLTFNAGTSSIVCSAVGATVAGGGLAFYDIQYTSTAPTTRALDNVGSARNVTVSGLTSAGITAFVATANTTISGTLTLSAGTNATMRTFVRSDTIGTTRTLTCAAVASLTDIDFRDITIAGAAAPVSGTRLGDCKGNSGITFPAAKTVYWRATSSTSWGTTSTQWAFSDGGTPNLTAFPLAQDTVVFSATYPNSGNTSTINIAYNIGTIDMSARTSNTMTLATGTTAPQIYGNWINGTGTTLTGTGAMTFAGRGSQTITSAGRTFTQPITVNSLGGSVTLQDAYNSSSLSSSAIVLTAGTLDASGYNVTIGSGGVAFSSGTTLAKTVAIGAGTWSLGNSTAWNVITPTNLIVTGTGTISILNSTARSFIGGGIQTYPTLNQGGTGTLTVTGSNKFAGLTNTAIGRIQFTGGTTNEFTSFTINGVSGNLLPLGSTNTTQAILQKGSAWLMGANSTDAGNNTNLSFTAGGGIDYLSVSYINGVVSTTAISASVSETSTASDAVAAFLTFLASTSETATATDTVDAPGSTFNPRLSEAATATDAVAGTLTLLAQVADALTGTDTVAVTLTTSASVSETATATDATEGRFAFAGIILESTTATDATSTTGTFNPSLAETSTATDSDSASGVFNPSLSETATATDAPSTANNTFNPSLAETATGADSPVANLSVTGAVSETATATDTTQSAVIFVGAVSETATATDLISALTDFLGQIAETVTATDITLVAPSVFGPQVQEAVAALDATRPINSTFNVQLVESATALDSVIGAYLWNLIDDNQNPNWANISNPQNPGWSAIDDSQNPNWQNVDT
jgi:hypothetical protein